MGKKGRKGRKKKRWSWRLLLLVLPLLLFGSLVLWDGVGERVLPKGRAKVSSRIFPHPPRLAIIIDDGGYHLDPVREILRIGKPMTFAILPGAPHSRETALLVHQEGGEVMLHLPMEPKEGSRLALEKNTVKGEMAPAGIRQILRESLSRIPHARGLNPHMGSKATEDPGVMEAIMEVLKEDGLYFIDSQTSSHSAGMKAAQTKGVPAGQNGKFLDAVRKTENIHESFRVAITLAKKGGKAIAIGHPDPLTLRALKEMVPEIEKVGIRLVFASEIVG